MTSPLPARAGQRARPASRSARGRPAALLCACLLLLAPPLHAEVITIPIRIDYDIVRKALSEYVFVDGTRALRVMDDAKQCNSLSIANPRLDDGGAGRLAVRLDVEARGGTPVGERCLLPFTWRGQIELFERAYMAPQAGVIAFRVEDSRLLTAAGGSGIPGILWTWVKQLVHPRLEAFHIDLSALLSDSASVLDALARQQPDVAEAIAATLRLGSPLADTGTLQIALEFELDSARAPAVSTSPEPTVLDAAALAAWDRQWQSWDAFATWAIVDFAREEPDALRAALMETLLEARYELRDIVSDADYTADPVRRLFISTWERLAPLVATAERAHDSGTALRYISFIGAGDALRALDAVAAQFGLRIDRNTLLELARVLDPALDPAELEYDLTPDPELRELLGLPPEPASAAPPPASSWLDRWISPVRADDDEQALARQLKDWVPMPDEIDRYLAVMTALLDGVRTHTLASGRVPPPFGEVYATLLRTTAWQESCWRQFVRTRGQVAALHSSAGSVGLMQVNRHVWRKVYDIQKLAEDTLYNARAGNEILTHYLVDYAIARKEHEIQGSPDDLARASYAVYNGGPRQLERYRRAETKASLRAIDKAFWRKYQAMKAAGPAAVRACYGP